MSVIQSIEVSVSEGLISETYISMRLRLLMFVRMIAMAVFGRGLVGLQLSMGVAKLSVERGFLVLRVDNLGRITVRYGVAGCSLFRGF